MNVPAHIAAVIGSLADMGIAKDAAPEIDRLVWSVNSGVAPKHGKRLGDLAGELSLDSLWPFPGIADFVLAGTAPVELLCRRMPYRDSAAIVAKFEELAAMGLVADSDGSIAATERLAPLLRTMSAAAADVAADTWRGHTSEVATATKIARKVGLAASDDHAVAVAHRELPAVDDPYLLMYDRLVTLRYVRQHDHLVAWEEQGLTPPLIVALTNLWHGEAVEDDAALAELVRRGLAETATASLTAEGRALRDQIEAETNRRAQATFDVLSADEADTFLTVLRTLPGSGLA